MHIRHILCFTSLALSGACVAAWGGAYNVALKNSRSIVIEYDPVVVNIPEILRVAQEHCDTFGRDAILSSTTTGNLSIEVNTYSCIERA